MIIENNRVLYYLQKHKPLTNVVFVTDDQDVLAYADEKKYFGIYISKYFFIKTDSGEPPYKKYAHIVAKDIITIEEMIDHYIVSVSAEMLEHVVNILSLPIHYLDINFVKMQINEFRKAR